MNRGSVALDRTVSITHNFSGLFKVSPLKMGFSCTELIVPLDHRKKWNHKQHLKIGPHEKCSRGGGTTTFCNFIFAWYFCRVTTETCNHYLRMRIGQTLLKYSCVVVVHKPNDLMRQVRPERCWLESNS